MSSRVRRQSNSHNTHRDNPSPDGMSSTRWDRLSSRSVVAWIGAEMEFALSQAVASGDTLEHRPSEGGHCVQDFLAELDLRDLPGEAAGLESAADDTLPTADLRFYPAALVVPCGHLPGHAAVAADLSNMAIPNGWIPRRLRSDHCVLWRRYNHIQGLPIPFPQQIPCGRSIIGAVSQKARDRGIEVDPGARVMQCCLQRHRESDWRKQSHRWPGPVRGGVCASGGVFP